MANIKSAKKRIITSRKSAALNNDVKKAMKTSIKNFEKSLNDDVKEAEKLLNLAIKRIDKAASSGVIKKNTAARYKSNIQTKFNKLSSK